MNGDSKHNQAQIAQSPGIATPGLSWDYSPAPETAKVTIAPRHDLFINGKFIAPKSKKYFASINPANEEVLSEIAEANTADVDAAVQAAKKAFPKWSRLDPRERAKYIFRIARRIQERARELAVLETMDGGKPITESRDVDIPLAAQHFFYHAGWADKLHYAFGAGWWHDAGRWHDAPRRATSDAHWWHDAPRRAESDSRHGAARSLRATRSVAPPPIGVCGQIIPWNFPLLMAAWKLAPALACGNTCVLKPAETTSLTALRLAEILQEIDLPPGVVNLITGAGATGQALVNHKEVRKIAFTGSTEVGKLIAKACAATDKKLTLELGGKSPNIIFEDASIDQAIEGIIQGIYFNQGHVCCAGSRLFVAESILDEVIAKLNHRMKSLRVGDPLDKNTDIGAINSKAQLATIHRYLDAGRAEGATLHEPLVERRSASLAHDAERRATNTNAERRATDLPSKGYWCRPCFFTDVQPSHIIAREEIFGPVLAVMSFRTPEEAILRANNTPYGLAAGVWTDKGSKIFEIARKLKAGVIWCNTYNKFDAASPFGGFKESGFGREGGMHGLRAYLNL